MKEIQRNEIIFEITKEDLQLEAQEKIGRELTDDEIQVAKKGLENGLLTGIGTIYQTIFNEMIQNERN
ncbi:MAG: hypothetical protein WBJ84_09465 [Bacteroidales bacterium]